MAGAADPIDFQLEIAAATASGYFVSARFNGGGEAGCEMCWQLAGPTLDQEVATVRDAVFASAATAATVRRGMPTQIELPVRELGRRLFDAAISGDVHTLYANAYQQSRRENRQMRLVLRTRRPELARLPWEYLFDSRRGEYLCLRMPVIRYPQLLEPPQPLAVTPPLRVLAMVAAPGDQATLDVQMEKSRLETALGGVHRRGQVELHWVQGQGWRDLESAMDQGAWHVFHFIGHGGFDEQSQEGVLALVGDDGRSFPLGASDLSLLLTGRQQHSLRLVLLNACETGRSGPLDSLSSTAGALVRLGIPAAVAMQFEITDQASIEFSRTFYHALAAGRPVDDCVVRGRRAVRIGHADTLEWGTPVLFLRGGDGAIFDMPPDGDQHTDDAVEGELPPLPPVATPWAVAIRDFRKAMATARRSWWIFLLGVLTGAVALFVVLPIIGSQPAPRIHTHSPTPSPLPAGSVVFDDDFSSPDNKGWATGHSADGNDLTALEPGALHETVKAGADGAYFDAVPGGQDLTSLRIDATMALTGGDGTVGLRCSTTGRGAYDFWIDSDGSVGIRVDADNSQNAVSRLLGTGVTKWDPTQRHVLTAACAQRREGTALTFQVNGHIVATAFDTTHTGSFKPDLVFQSTQQAALDVDVLHVTVANLA